MPWLLVLLSLLPVWRDSMHPGEGRDLYEYFEDVHQQPYYDSHIPYSEAVTKAQEAYRSCLTNKQKSVLVILASASFLPIFRSGGRTKPDFLGLDLESYHLGPAGGICAGRRFTRLPEHHCYK